MWRVEEEEAVTTRTKELKREQLDEDGNERGQQMTQKQWHRRRTKQRNESHSQSQ
jgi:hypothetical protein